MNVDDEDIFDIFGGQRNPTPPQPTPPQPTVEQAVVYSILPHGYSITLPERGELSLVDGGRE